MGRILIFTGKGGVGKTSMAAAHARSSAREGKKTLLVSTDMAHNLGDIFDVSLERCEKEVAPDLFVLELDPIFIMEHEYQNMMQAIVKMMISERFQKEDMDTTLMFPGIEELFSLMKILDVYESEVYERIIVDCAPTGETLSLLKFPELFTWYIEKLFPIGKVAVRVLAPISKRAFKVELPDRKAMNDIEKLYTKLAQLQDLLRNRQVTSIRLVTIPEKMVVEETKRNYMYMNLYNYLVDGIYINRILSKDMEETFFEEWVKIQASYVEELEDMFSGRPLYYVPWFDTDLNGLNGIDQIVDQVLAGKDIFAVREDIKQERYENNAQGYLLYVSVPYAKKEEIDLYLSGTDVIIKIGNFKRNIPLPDTLRAYEITDAKLEDGELRIQFEQEGDNE